MTHVTGSVHKEVTHLEHMDKGLNIRVASVIRYHCIRFSIMNLISIVHSGLKQSSMKPCFILIRVSLYQTQSSLLNVYYRIYVCYVVSHLSYIICPCSIFREMSVLYNLVQDYPYWLQNRLDWTSFIS